MCEGVCRCPVVELSICPFPTPLLLQMGLEIDPELESRAQAVFDEGMVLFNAGKISKSYDK